MSEIGIDPERVARSVSTMLRLVDALDGREFAFRDPQVIGSPVTDAFDRAYHALSWTVAQCVSGSERELLDDADAIASVVAEFSELDDEIAIRLQQARRLLDQGGF